MKMISNISQFYKDYIGVDAPTDINVLSDQAIDLFAQYTSFPSQTLYELYPEVVKDDIKKAICLQVRYMSLNADKFNYKDAQGFIISKWSKQAMNVSDINSISRINQEAYNKLAKYGFVSTVICQ